MGEKHKKRLRDVASFAALVLVVSSARASLADHYRVPSESMRPTIEIGDRILVNKLAFGLRIPFTSIYAAHFSKPERGDVVILESPADGSTLVKRVMGLPGDRIEVKDGRVLVGGEPIALEEHLPLAHGGRNFGPLVIPDQQYLVLGDNRDDSFDGRYFGLVDEDALRGKAERIYYSEGRFTWEDL
jgi:signal peptidase I